MPELVVDPAALLAVAGPLAAVADRLDAVAAALPGLALSSGPDDVTRALEDAAHVWQRALRGIALAVDGAGERLVSAASAYDGVEATVRDWASR